MDVVGLGRAEVQGAREHDACVVDEFFEAVNDDDELPSASEVSDGSDNNLDSDQREARVVEDAGGEETMDLVLSHQQSSRAMPSPHYVPWNLGPILMPSQWHPGTRVAGILPKRCCCRQCKK